MKLALVVHPLRESAVAAATALVAAARDRGVAVTARPDDCRRIAGCTERADDGAGDADVVVAVGGDGTVLEAVRLGIAAGIPVLGVNAGHVGFLTEVEPDGVGRAVDRLVAGEYEESTRMTLQATLPGQPPVAGLNDVVVEKLISRHVVKLVVSVGAEQLLEYRADAVVVATPTGSTAYTFSAGGPLVDPELDALVVTPVAPHNLFGRPIVFRPTVELRLDVVDDRPARVNLDGRIVGELEPGEGVVISQAPTSVRLIRFTPRNFAASVRDKFHLHDA